LSHVLGSVGASQLDKTGCCQALRQVLPMHLHGKALPKLLQCFEFASWFAIFWIAKPSFCLDCPRALPKWVFIVVHDLATPHDAFDDNARGDEDSESGPVLLKNPGRDPAGQRFGATKHGKRHEIHGDC